MIATIHSWSRRLMRLSSAVLCSATRHRTLLNSGTLVLVHLTAMGTGFLPRKLIVGRGVLKTSCGCCRTVWPYTRNGANYVGRILTFNEKDFARYTDIEAVNPRTISAKHP